MRKSDADLYAAARKASEAFVATFKKETLPIVYEWSERESKASTSIIWLNPDDYEGDGLYGTSAGLYISAESGEYFIFLPKTTKAFITFVKAMEKMHISDNIPNEVMLSLDGVDTVEFKVVTYIEDVTNETEMTEVKKLTNMLIDMLWRHKVEFYEGDNEPKESVYRPGDKEPANYYVGFKGEYDIYNI